MRRPALTRQRSIFEVQDSSSNIWLQAINAFLFFFYLYAYIVDNAGENVRKGTNCTYMPEIFLAMFITNALMLISVFCSIPMLAGAKAQSDAGNADAAIDNIWSWGRFIGCIYLLSLAAGLGLAIWAVQDYFQIDGECWDFVEKEGSHNLKIAFQIYGIMSLVSICVCGLICICSCFGICYYATHGSDSMTAPLI